MVDYVKAECAGDKVISFVIKLAVEDTSIMITPYHRDFADRLKPNAPQLIITFASPMTISGHEFNDLDGDGVKDDGEPALEGWTVNLAGSVSKTTTSDSAGYYEFTDLTSGTYTVSEVLQDGWVQTEPAPPGTYTVSLTSSSVTDMDFGNFKPVTITADKWNDLDGDGVREGDEPEISGWKLTLTHPDGVTTDTKDSPASWVVGKGGTYTITEELQDGWTHITADRVDVSVQSGEAPPTAWFGNFKEATVVVYKYEDADGNLATTDDWTPIDWPITLTSGSGDVTGSTGTAGMAFSGLGPGLVTVTEAEDPAWAHLNPSSWSQDVESGGTYEVKFVNFHKGMVSGHKFDDVDNNGSWDNGEPALKGWTIKLTGRDLPVDLTAVTDDQGYYEFRDLMAGEYTITEEPQAGWLQTAPAGGTYTIEIKSGSVVANRDFGNLKLVTITADKWNDLDGDGVKDDGEPEITGWGLKITYPDGVTTDTKDSPASWVVKDYGDYAIAEEFQEGWAPTTPSSAVVTVQSRDSPSTIWFGNFELVYLTADKFEDINGDGVKDGSEPEITGWRLKILCPNGTTNEMGSPASWVVKQGGMYTITEEEGEGYVNTTPISVDVMVQSGDTPEKVWFGNFKKVTIAADKWNDIDGDGVRDNGEPEIPGWQLTITCPNGTTSTLGSPASWVVKQGGEYTIMEELQDGWVQTTEGSVGITVQSGDAPDMVWFGNFKEVTITAGKYNDLNGNGELDEDELEIFEWKLTLHYPDGTTNTMDSPASWVVGKGGTYTIAEEPRDGWIHTTPDSVAITVQSGDAPDMVWFGNFELGSISGYKIDDLNGNGFRNEGDPTLEGWIIHLDGYDTITKVEVHRTTVTDHNGHYEFKGLTNGTYTVSEEPKPGWIQILGTYTIDVTSGTSEYNDFYNFKLVNITADKFDDIDGDGERDSGEPEISGWKLTLTYPDGVTTDTKDSPASWLVAKGTYILTEELQDGWIQTTEGSEKVNVVKSDDTPPTVWFGNFKEATVVVYKYEDADGNLATTDDWTPIDWPVTLTNSSGDWAGKTGTTGKVFYSQNPGTIMVTEADDPEWVHLNSSNTWTKQVESGGTYVVKFVNFKLVTITADKFDDIDGDGERDSGEPEISGWKLTLTYPDGVTTDTKDSPASWTVGRGGTYTITEELQDGWVQTTADIVYVDVKSGGNPSTVWLGNFKLGKISGYKWEDINGDGTRDQDEPVLKDWEITLTKGSSIMTTKTDENGYFEFTGLTAGTYFVNEVLQSGWIQTYPVTSHAYTVQIISGSIEEDRDFGNFKLVTITADKWNDLNGDGVMDGNEPEIPGWALTITYPDGSTNTMDSPASWTVGQGGTYTITEEPRDGWFHTTADSVVVSVKSGDTPSIIWFGNFEFGIISGYKFNDLDGDGIKDTDELGLKDWTIDLDGYDSTSNMPVHLATTTDANGYYEFRDLFIGTYTVSEETQSGWIQTKPMPSGTYAIYITTSGQKEIDKDFGNFKLAYITADKFNDLDGDGVKDDGELEIQGWELKITCPNGTTNMMDSPASWVVLQGGEYTITEEPRDGWIHTSDDSAAITVQSGGTPSTVWFGNFKEATVVVYKYEDADGNLATTSDWTPIDWPITLKSGSGDMTGSTGTAGKAFGGLGPGHITVTEAEDPAWAHMNSSSWSQDVESGGTYIVNFVNFKLVTITADKWEDINGNSKKDDSEPEIPGWQLTIEYPDGTTDTKASPASWTVGQGGTYTITEEPRDGWFHTTADSVVVSVKSGSVHDTIWFGNFKLVTITADKFDDVNGNGMRDKDEPEITGWKLTLHYPDGVTTDTKDSPAEWIVDKSGVYAITEESKEGWIPTTKSNVETDVKSGSTPSTIWFGNFKEATVVVYKYEDADGNLATTSDWTPIDWTVSLTNGLGTFTGSTGTKGKAFSGQGPGSITVTEADDPAWVRLNGSSWSGDIESGRTYIVNFVNFKLVTITADKWEDLNGNGVKDDDESEIPGWKLTLHYPDGVTTDTMDSPASWTVKQGGKYTITEADKSGWAHTTASSVSIGVKSGDKPSTIWFGNSKLIAITADKWNDLDGDGKRDNGEPEISGWKLTITCPNGTTSTLGSPASWVVRQGGNYIITEDDKCGWAHTTASSVSIIVKSGDKPSTIWFGNFKLVTITADKWNDIDGDGVRDRDEPEIKGWKLTIRYPDGTTNTMDSPASWTVKQGGKYTITEEARCDWVHTTASSVDLVVQSGDTPSMVWFGNRHKCYKKVTNGWLSDTSEQRIEVTDFKIVFTPSKGTYKISSTNPGGFYFNVLYQTGADPTTISYTLANNGNGDFATQGSMPVHAYIWNDLDKDGKIDYWGELTDITNKITTAQEPDLTKGTIRVKGVPTGTNVLITIHITFALKGTSGYDLNEAKAFEGKLYTFTANGGFNVQATLKAHAKI